MSLFCLDEEYNGLDKNDEKIDDDDDCNEEGDG